MDNFDAHSLMLDAYSLMLDAYSLMLDAYSLMLDTVGLSNWNLVIIFQRNSLVILSLFLSTVSAQVPSIHVSKVIGKNTTGFTYACTEIL